MNIIKKPFGIGRLTLIFIFTISIFLAAQLQAQTFAWAKHAGGSAYGWAFSMATDAAGNVYTVGRSNGSMTFGSISFPAPPGEEAGYISKQAPDGTYIWVKRIYTSGTNAWEIRPKDVTIGPSGNIFVCGDITDDCPGHFGTITLAVTSPSSSSIDAFVCKLNASGTFLWAKRMGGPGEDGGNAIAVDNSGNVYTTGYFDSTADFNPGPGTAYLTTPGTVYNYTIFVSKLDNNGNYVWAKQMAQGLGAFTYLNRGTSIVTDASGNIYYTGLIYGPVDFNPGSGTYTLGSSKTGVFLSKLTSSGTFVWAKMIGGDGPLFGGHLAIDNSNNLYLTGSFSGTNDFNPGSGTVNLTSTPYSYTNNTFIAKYNSSGGFIWVNQFKGAYNDGIGITLDKNNNVYTIGTFGPGTIDLNPGSGTANVTTSSTSGYEVYVSKLDQNGNYIWGGDISRGASTTYNAEGNAIAIGPCGGIYTSGGFGSTADFNPGSGTYNMTPTGPQDLFIQKMTQSNYFTASAGSNSPLCANAQLNLTSSPGGGTYSWTGPGSWTSSSQNPTRNPVLAGTYNVTVTSPAGCTAQASVSVTINPLPATPTISGSSSVCNGGSINLTGNPSGGAWSETNGTGSATVSGGTVSGTSSGTVTIKYTVSNSCGTATATKNITINPLPNAGAISGPSSVCVGSTITLSESVGGGSWSASNGDASVSSSGVVTGNTTGTVTITYTVTNSCGTATATKTISVITLPDAGVISGPATVCQGATIALSSNGNAGGSWSASNGDASVSSSGVVTGISSGSLTITYTVTTSCGTDQATKTITVNSKPTATASDNGSICVGGELILSASGGSSYSWTGPNGFSSSQQNPDINPISSAGSGTYTVIVSNGSGCTDTATVSVGFVASPIATAISNSPICEGDSLVLSAGAIPGGGSNAWIGPNGFSSNQGTVVIYPTTLADSGIYSVIASKSGSGCVDTASIDVHINPTYNDTIYTSICAGQSYTLPDNSTTDSAGTYVSNLQSSTTCDSTIVTILTMHPQPVAYFSAPNGCAGSQTVFTDSSTIGNGGSITQWYWNFGDGDTSDVQNPTHTYMGGNGSYVVTLTVTSAAGCSSSYTDTVTELSNGGITTYAWADTGKTYPDTPIQFHDSSTGNVTEWEWNFGDGNTSTIQNPGHTFQNPGQYNVVVTASDANGCADTAIVKIDILDTIFIPNVFTPNGDGVNDVFYITGGGFSTFTFKVYNRWGTLLFSSESPRVAWDGRTNAGKKVSSGTYFFILIAKRKGKDYSHTGYVTLLR